jgi:hypothetical protein
MPARSAIKLDIPYYLIDEAEEFQKHVIHISRMNTRPDALPTRA